MLSMNIKIILMLASAIGLLGIGWQVSNWRTGAKESAENRALLEKAITDFNAARDELNAEIRRLSEFNEETSVADGKLIVGLDSLNRRVREIKDEIKNVDTGTAVFSPDADRLFYDAYRAATGEAADPASSEADSGNDSERAATASTGNLSAPPRGTN